MNKSDSMKFVGLIQPLPIPTALWSEISMDFIKGLPSSNRYTMAMVIVDGLSKYAHFIAFRHPFTAFTIAKAIIANVVRLNGVPTTIVSDHDKLFLSHFWKALFHMQRTTLNMSFSYHPQSDG